MDDHIKPVLPWLSLEQRSASKSNSSLHAASFPSRAALKRGCAPLLSLTTTLPPFSNRDNIHSSARWASSLGLERSAGSMNTKSVAVSPAGVGCTRVSFTNFCDLCQD